jgi:transposase-like protein
MSKTERRPRLTAARKFELYLATRSADAPLGEILRQYGVHLDDLRAIECIVENSALAGLKAQTRHGRQPTVLSPERGQQLEQELAEKTRALAELGVSFALLEKKERAESGSRSRANGSRRRNAR